MLGERLLRQKHSMLHPRLPGPTHGERPLAKETKYRGGRLTGVKSINLQSVYLHCSSSDQCLAGALLSLLLHMQCRMLLITHPNQDTGFSLLHLKLPLVSLQQVNAAPLSSFQSSKWHNVSQLSPWFPFSLNFVAFGQGGKIFIWSIFLFLPVTPSSYLPDWEKLLLLKPKILGRCREEPVSSVPATLNHCRSSSPLQKEDLCPFISCFFAS